MPPTGGMSNSFEVRVENSVVMTANELINIQIEMLLISSLEDLLTDRSAYK